MLLVHSMSYVLDTIIYDLCLTKSWIRRRKFFKNIIIAIIKIYD